MVLIKTDKQLLVRESTNLINFYRKNPIIAANQLLKVEGEPLNLAPIQQVVLSEWWTSSFSLLTASRGSGKSLAHGTKVLTDIGWKAIEKLKSGDSVITPGGLSSKIVDTFYQGIIPTCKILLQDGRECYCSYDHLWGVIIDDEYIVLDTRSIISLNLGDITVKIPCYITDVFSSIKIELIDLLSIEQSIDQECTCIKIEDPRGLFIIDNNIITHNTFMSAVYIALQTLLYPSTKIGIFAPAFRQSKFIFKEFENLYENSPILQQCIQKVPTYGNDACTCIFKPVSKGIKPSVVKALPVGTDGGKIRGERFNCVILDETPHLPETIFRSAIHPMMSTAMNPMKRVKEIEKMKQMGEINLKSNTQGNRWIGITSGYYQFNYWWGEIIKFYNEIKNGSKLYSLRFIPYYELPEGFYDTNIVRDAELYAPKHMFLTEWLADWISDSEGAFSMSLLESVRDPLIKPKYCKDPNLDKGKDFIFGIDVARESDSSAITVWELGYPSKLVHIEELENTPFPDQAKTIFDLIHRFKPLRIYMDEFGGGHTLRDHLAKPEDIGLPNSIRVIEVEKSTKEVGNPILVLCNFNSAFIEDANNNSKTLLEQRAIKLPDATNPIEKTKGNKAGYKIVDLVQEMINQISSVVVTQTTTGRLHYDLPKKKGSAINPVTAKKDLYTAFILGCKCIYDLQWKPHNEKVMSNKVVIREIENSTKLTGYKDNDTISRGVHSTISNVGTPDMVKIKGGGVIIRKNGRR